MNSLFEEAGNAEAVQRIEALAPDARPQWGKMNLAQMLAHCQRPFRTASGELKLKRGLPGLLLGRWAKKKFIVGDAPFGRNSPTDPNFLVPGASDIEHERTELIALVKRFADKTHLTQDPHPFFGRLPA